MAKKNVSGNKVALGVGLGLAGLAAGAGAYYFYAAKGAEKNRKKAEKWAHDLKAEVIKKAKLAKKLDEKAMKVIVGEATKAYEKVQSVDKKDLTNLATELMQNWTEVKKEVERTAGKSAVAAKKSVKTISRAAKKVVAKAKAPIVKNPAKKAAKKAAKKTTTKKSSK